ncbi:hypothetical protein [Dyadobacter sp. OTU695]|uniref:hypothetical protein n=1 Tax=Dyadobacter sp. OTU695 TaxID=3043860 RepID=UPI00313B2F3D
MKPPIPDWGQCARGYQIMSTNILFFCQQKNSEKIIISDLKQTIYRIYGRLQNTCRLLPYPAEIPMAQKSRFQRLKQAY